MAMIQEEQNNNVCIEISNMLSCLTNENVKGNVDRQLNVWCLIFSRVLRVDGKRMLWSRYDIRSTVKQRAHDALTDYPDHPIEELATKINNFLYRVEFLGLELEDIHEEQL